MIYKDKIFQGATFPDKPVNDSVKITFTKEILNEYIPASNEVEMSKGLRLLCTIMTHKEGFKKGTRSYRTNNPGNIGNTDSGANKSTLSLKDGIKLQRDFITRIVEGKSKTFPVGKQVNLKPYYSKEIAANEKVYGMSPYLPGYSFIFNGELEGFVKIYSTGARAGNLYLSMIISFFKNHGIKLTPKSTLQEIINIK